MHLRAFISSPGDVPDERTFAQQVIEQELPKDPLLRGSLTCEAVRWDDPAAPAAMPATLTPQAAVNAGLPKPSECDVVIVIVWSRLGTPLPADMVRPDGSRYLSGTEWEYEDAVNAAKPPHVLVYRRKSKLEIDPDDEKADEKNEQMARVRQFLKRFRNSDGSLNGGFAEYDTPQQFRDRLRIDLRNYLQQHLEPQPAAARMDRVRAPPPYGVIAKALCSGRLVPFIGPDAVHSGRMPGAHWDPSAPLFLPSGAELSRLLADESSFPAEADREHLAEVASYYEVVATRDVLRDRLRQFFGAGALGTGDAPPLYALLAAVQAPLLIVTTNYDTGLERAFHAAGRPYDLVVYPADRKDLGNAVLWWEHGATAPATPAPNELDIDLGKRTVIFKMHGTIMPEAADWDGVVITESDNVEFLARVGGKSAIPPLLAAHIKYRSLLFLGFALRDWSFRSIVRSLKWGARKDEGEEDIRSWAVDEQFSELELQLWVRIGVYPFELPLDEFAARLRERMPT
jgi:hypothetical protein